MNAKEIGTTLVELCREGKGVEAIEQLYANDVVSVEAGGPPGMDRVTNGKAAELAKSKAWRENHEVHAAKCDGPFPHEDRFAVVFDYDITHKPSGRRFPMKEVALYTTKDGKITRTEFFYGT